MNINDLLVSGANVAITITPTDLKEFALMLIDETLAAKNQKPAPETYLTPDDVASALGVSKNTLWRWDKMGYLKPVKVGRKPLYKRSEVDGLLAASQHKINPSRGT